MTPTSTPLGCPRCSRNFTRTSSLVRHSERCLQDLKAPPRQKACRTCSASKLRCDLQRPRCGRCQERAIVCEYLSKDGTAIPSGTPQSQLEALSCNPLQAEEIETSPLDNGTFDV
ncbi:hypothetical protein GQ53DRAFT_844884, partial [Thozetella sp. PMI_491]